MDHRWLTQKPTTGQSEELSHSGDIYAMSSFKVRDNQERVVVAWIEPEVGEDQGETSSHTSQDLYTHEIMAAVVAHTRLSQLALVWREEFISPQSYLRSYGQVMVSGVGRMFSLRVWLLVVIPLSSGWPHIQAYMASTN